VVNSTSIAKLGNLEKRRLPVPSPVQTRHPPCQSLLIPSRRRARPAHSPSTPRVLADLKLPSCGRWGCGSLLFSASIDCETDPASCAIPLRSPSLRGSAIPASLPASSSTSSSVP